MSNRKDNLRKFQTITNGAMTGTSVLTSAITSIQWLDDIGLQFNWTGSPTGTFQVLISIDYAQDTEGNVQVAGNWAPLLLSYWNGTTMVTGYTVPTSIGSPIYLDLALLSAPWIQVTYTNASGTGTLNTFISAKQV